MHRGSDGSGETFRGREGATVIVPAARGVPGFLRTSLEKMEGAENAGCRPHPWPACNKEIGNALINEGPLLCRPLDVGKKEAPQAQLTGVQNAPRLEVAGN